MKTKWFLRILTSLVVLTLVFGTASFASAKGSDKDKTVQKEKDQGKKEDKSSNNKESIKNQKEDKSSTKKETKEKVVIKSKIGKTFELRLNTIDSSINSISKSVDSYFGVTDEGSVDKERSKITVNKKYNSYKGKLKAEINKLRAIEKQLVSSKKKFKSNATEFEAIVAKSRKLQQIAADEIKRVESLEVDAATPKPADENLNSPEDATTPTEPATTPTEPATTPTEPATTPTEPATTTEPSA